jgi:hypothetical protein
MDRIDLVPNRAGNDNPFDDINHLPNHVKFVTYKSWSVSTETLLCTEMCIYRIRFYIVTKRRHLRNSDKTLIRQERPEE